MATKYELRLADPSDIPGLMVVDRAANRVFAGLGLIRTPDGLPEPVPGRAFALSIDSGLLFVAQSPPIAPDRGLIGFAMSRIYKPDLLLEQLSVLPEWTRIGVGRALIERTMDCAKMRRLKHVVVSTFRDVAWNGPMYRRRGFQEIPRRKLRPWHLAIEAGHRELMDVDQRCFMQKKVRSSPLFGS